MRPKGSGPSSVVYGAGLENRPDLVARLAAGRTLLGCTPETLRRVRDPAVLGASLRAAGLRVPAHVLRPGGAGAGGSHHAAGCASRSAAAAAAGCVSGAAAGRAGDVIVQERIAGLPCSAAAVADGRSAALLGVSEQLIGRRALGARGWTWCGNVVPPRLPAREQRRAGRRRPGDLRAPGRRVRPARRVRRGLRLGRRARVGGGGQPAPDRVARDDRRRARRPLVRGAPGGVRRTPAGCAARRSRPGRPARRCSSRPRTCGRRTRASGRPAGSATCPTPASRSPPAARSARSSRRDAPRRPCSPSWRRAPPRCAASSTKWASMPSHERSATCGGCGLVCDDITAVVGDDGGLERLIRTCPLGDAWFAERVAPAAPLARVDGARPSWTSALDEAAAILARARAPLVYGLGQTTLRGAARRGGAGRGDRRGDRSRRPAARRRVRARVPGARSEHGHAGRGPRPRRGRRGVARRPGRDAPAAAGAPAASRRRAASSSSSTSGGRRPRRRPTRSWSFRRTATSRRCGRCARSSARRRSRPSRRSTSSPRVCAAAATRRSCTTCAGTSRRSACTRSSATSAGSRTPSP